MRRQRARGAGDVDHGRSKPALILLDLTMPEMDGWTFRQEQQKVPRLAQIPVVLFSGHHDAARAAQSLNAVALMTKPLRLDDDES